MRREINTLEVICAFFKASCNWEGKFEDYKQHVNTCEYEPRPDFLPFIATVSPTQSLNGELTHVPCEACQRPVRLGGLQEHYKVCPLLSLCPLNCLGCPHTSYMDQTELAEHMEMSHLFHLELLARRMQDLSNFLENNVSTREPHVNLGVDGNIHPCLQQRNSTQQHQIELRKLDNMQNRSFTSVVEDLQWKEEEVAFLHTQDTKLENQI